MCRIGVLALLAGGPAAWGAEAPTELALVRGALEQPWLQSRLTAAEAGIRSDATVPALLGDPVLTARREQANGPAGANTRAVGGEFSVDLGLSGLPLRTASRHRGRAAERDRRRGLLDAVCTLREEALDLVAADGAVQALRVSQDRLDAVEEQLGAEAREGLISGFDLRRLERVSQTHRVHLGLASGRRADAAASLAARTGVDPEGLTLQPLGALEDLDAWVERARTSDPRLATLRERLAAARAQRVAERRASVPDLTVQGGARWDAMPDGSERAMGWELGGALELPLFDRGRVARRRVDTGVRQAEALVEEREVELRARIGAAWSEAERLSAVAAPSAEEGLWEGAVERYRAGESTLSVLLDVARESEEAALADVDRRDAVRRARLELACTAGAFEEPALQALIDEVSP